MKSTKRRTPTARAARGYRQEARAEQTQANLRAVLDAAVAHLRTARRVADVTLEGIAADASVTVRTILRQFGSKDGIMEAAFAEIGKQIEAYRQPTAPGDVDAALRVLLTQYEAEGDLNARVLSEEHEIPILHRLLQHGRKIHRQWLTDVFAPRLAHLPPAQREQRITALYAATEVLVWKVLRRDLHQSAEQTAVIFRQLVNGLLNT
jgi:AcrR family transcriptional regulator